MASQGPFKGAVSAQKSTSRVRDRDEGVAGRNIREKCFPDKGSLICPLGKSMISYEKIELVPRPVTNQSSKRSSKRKSSCIHSLKTGNFNFFLSGPKYKGRISCWSLVYNVLAIDKPGQAGLADSIRVSSPDSLGSRFEHSFIPTNTPSLPR